jgi:TRAP-type C4-dicarboxylate transport system permease small subunit
MRLFFKVFDRTLSITCAVLYALLTALAFAQVMVRYFLGGSLSWSEEAVRFLFIWLSFIGFSITMHREGHIGVKFIVDLMPRPFQRVFALFSDACILGFLCFFIVKGIGVCRVTLYNLSPAINIPMGYVYGILPLSGILLVISTLRVAARHWSSEFGIESEGVKDA